MLKRAKLAGLQRSRCNQGKLLVVVISESISELGVEIYCYRGSVSGVV